MSSSLSQTISIIWCCWRTHCEVVVWQGECHLVSIMLKVVCTITTVGLLEQHVSTGKKGKNTDSTVLKLAGGQSLSQSQQEVEALGKTVCVDKVAQAPFIFNTEPGWSCPALPLWTERGLASLQLLYGHCCCFGPKNEFVFPWGKGWLVHFKKDVMALLCLFGNCVLAQGLQVW